MMLDMVVRLCDMSAAQEIAMSDLFDLATMSADDIHMLRGPASSLQLSEGTGADGAHTFAWMKERLESRGYHFYGPGEHPLPTRFAVRHGDKPFNKRSAIRDLCQAFDLMCAYDAMNEPRHIKSTF